ncbi:MAG: P-II family nitrogen regulator [Huintestinicola sp.]
MKYIEIIIRPSRYAQTKEDLAESGFNSAIVIDVIGRGRKDCSYELTDSSEPYNAAMPFVAKKYVGIYAIDEDVDKIIEIVKKNNSNGCGGDGKIFVYDLEEAVRISSGVRGEDALV